MEQNKKAIYKLASYEEIKQNDYRLSLKNYVEDNEPKEEIDIDKIERELEEIIKRRLETEAKIAEAVREIKQYI